MATGAIARPSHPAHHYGGILEWLLTTDHKKIGVMYAGFNLTFFILGILVFFVNLVKSMASPKDAGPDPWEANTLEWMTSSPPPEHNFDFIPPIESDRPAFDQRVHRVHTVVGAE